MSLMTSHLEPFLRDGDVCILRIDEGQISEVDLQEFYNPNVFTKPEREYLTKYLNYRWALPKDLMQKGGTPRDIRAELIAVKDLAASIVRFLRKYVWLQNAETYELLACWVIATYFRPDFRHMPIIIVDGITETGKSTLAKCLELISYRAENWTSVSAAAMAREIEDYDATIIMDESIDALTSESRGNDLYTMLRSCFEKGQKWIRADPRGRNNYVYNVYTSVAMCVKGMGLPEDVYNRGIRINMTAAPAHISLGDLDNWHEDVRDRDNPDEIRSGLYRLKVWSMAYPDNDAAVSFTKEKEETRKYVTAKLDNGQWFYAYVFGFPQQSPMIRGRDRNIAGTLLSIAQKTGGEIEIISEILRNKEGNQEVYMDTPEAVAFLSMMELVEEAHTAMGGLHPEMDYSTFAAAAASITTTDIARRFNEILDIQGNAGRDPVATKTVTAKINALGFKYERREQNKSFLVPSKDFANLFLQNVKKYARGKTKAFIGIQESG